MSPSQAFFAAVDAGKLPVAVPGLLAKFPINTSQGTFLAYSEDRKARAIAAIMACADAREALSLR